MENVVYIYIFIGLIFFVLFILIIWEIIKFIFKTFWRICFKQYEEYLESKEKEKEIV